MRRFNEMWRRIWMTDLERFIGIAMW
jgi:hypothetical protein